MAHLKKTKSVPNYKVQSSYGPLSAEEQDTSLNDRHSKVMNLFSFENNLCECLSLIFLP
jgi:hypothetical protein